MTFIDTGFLVALAQPADALHQRALLWANSLLDTFILTEYILCEVVNYLSAPVDRPKAHEIVSLILNDSSYELIWGSQQLFEAGLQLHNERSDKEETFWRDFAKKNLNNSE